MGSSSTTFYYAGFSGQNGGRVLPGQSYKSVKGGMAEIYLTPITADDGTYSYTTYRHNVLMYTGGRGVSGGGAGEAGYDTMYLGVTTPLLAETPTGIFASNGNIVYGGNNGGGGGGWGARGGDWYYDYPTNSIAPVFGGAGGKAVQTNGHAVTWLGGSNRAYGAVG